MIDIATQNDFYLCYSYVLKNEFGEIKNLVKTIIQTVLLVLWSLLLYGVIFNCLIIPSVLPAIDL